MFTGLFYITNIPPDVFVLYPGFNIYVYEEYLRFSRVGRVVGGHGSVSVCKNELQFKL